MANDRESEPPDSGFTDTFTTMPMEMRWQRAVEAATHGDAATVIDLQPGAQVGRYQLITQIAKGGMATVWVAWRTKGDGSREVAAVKTLLPHLVEDQGFVKMFLDEAKVLATIQHPNVVGIRDVGVHGTTPYVAMEWVDGDSLNTLLKEIGQRQKDMPLAIALRIVGETCLGLHNAHELRGQNGEVLNLVHRDVSPVNVLLSSTGDVKLIDFGVAKTEHRLADQTKSGVLKGKISYMSPEHALRKAIDRRADVYAAGVVLYRLVAGRLPYGGDILEMLRQLQGGEPTIPLPPSVPRPVADVIHQAMARDPEQRYQNAAQMRRAIQFAYAEVCAPLSKEQFSRFVVTYLGARINERRQALARVLR